MERLIVINRRSFGKRGVDYQNEANQRVKNTKEARQKTREKRGKVWDNLVHGCVTSDWEMRKKQKDSRLLTQLIWDRSISCSGCSYRYLYILYIQTLIRYPMQMPTTRANTITKHIWKDTNFKKIFTHIQ